MSKKTNPVTTADLESFERGVASALTIVIGLLAEATGSHKLAYHFGASLHAAEKMKPNPTWDRLLDEAFRLVLVKAMHHAPDDPVLQDLAASLRARQTKH